MYDVVAIGNALVDTEFTLSDAALDATGLARGNMTLVDTNGQNMLFAALNEQNLKPAKQAGGGSAANSMVAFAALGGRAYYHCRVGGDDMGDFYLGDLANLGVATDATYAVQADGQQALVWSWSHQMQNAPCKRIWVQAAKLILTILIFRHSKTQNGCI